MAAKSGNSPYNYNDTHSLTESAYDLVNLFDDIPGVYDTYGYSSQNGLVPKRTASNANEDISLFQDYGSNSFTPPKDAPSRIGGGDTPDTSWWGKGGKFGTIFDGITAIGSLYNGYQANKAAKERNKLYGEDLAHRKSIDLENLANLRVTTGNELQRQAWNAQQMGATAPVFGLPDSSLVPNTPTVDLNKLNVA